jgi:hypothetical protein
LSRRTRPNSCTSSASREAPPSGSD